MVMTTFVAVQTARSSNLPNGGFDNGDFFGWTISIPTGTCEFGSGGQPAVGPAGSACVSSSYNPGTGVTRPITSPNNSDFAIIGTAGTAYFMGNLHYDITASQSLSLNAGDIVSGWTLFYNGDYEPQDKAFVKFLNSDTDSLVATPWSATSGRAGYDTASPWTYWQWRAPSSGNYTLEIGMTTFGDDTFASYGMFDGISIHSVPEPSSISLLGLGVFGLGVIRHRPKR